MYKSCSPTLRLCLNKMYLFKASLMIETYQSLKMSKQMLAERGCIYPVHYPTTDWWAQWYIYVWSIEDSLEIWITAFSTSSLCWCLVDHWFQELLANHPAPSAGRLASAQAASVVGVPIHIHSIHIVLEWELEDESRSPSKVSSKSLQGLRA